MFDALRKMILPIILIVLFFFVAMIVLEWGLGMSSRQNFENINAAGVINGEEVDWAIYNNIYQNLYQTAIQQSPEGEVTDAQAEQLQQQAWDQLLYDRLLTQEARKYNFAVTDQELYSFLRFSPPPDLQAMPYFQTNGQFDYQKYLQTMADPQAAGFWAQIEPSMRHELIKLKLQDMILQSVSVTEDEVREAFLARSEKVKVAAAIVPYADFSKPPPSPTDEQLQAWYEEHKDKYHLDERASLNLVMLNKEPEEADWAAQEQAANAILDSLKNGADFAEMARRYSEGPSATDGGDLGWFSRGQMVPEFDRKVQQMKDGELSEPVRTKFGWHIILKQGERPVPNSTDANAKQYHASHILFSVNISPETLDEFYRRMEEFRGLAREIGFKEAADQLGMDIRTTQPFFRGGNVQFLGNAPKANVFAFVSEDQAISPVLESETAVYVVQRDQLIPAGVASFEDARQKVADEVVSSLVASLCRDTAQSVYADIQSGMDLKAAADKYGFEFAEIGPFTRTSTVAKLRNDPAAIGASFGLKTVGEVSQPVDFSQGTAILKLLERTNPDLSEFTEKRDSLYQTVLQLKRREMLSAWYEKLRDDAEIINNVERAREEELAANQM